MLGDTFKELKSAKILGVRVSRSALLSTAHRSGLVKRYLTRMAFLHSAGVHQHGLNILMALFLYHTFAHSLLLYTLPLHESRSPITFHIQKLHHESLCTILDLPTTTPAEVVVAETGSQPIEDLARVSHLMLLHRILNNPQDTLTGRLVSWPAFGPVGVRESLLERAKSTLRSILPTTTWAIFIRLTYRDAKARLKEAAIRRYKSAWRNFGQLQLLQHPRSYIISKPTWGPDKLLLAHRPHRVGLYLRVRHGLQPLHVSERGGCKYCPAVEASIEHQLWVCPHWVPQRVAFYTHASLCPPAMAFLRAQNPHENSIFVLGGAAAVLPSSAWKRLLPHCLVFVSSCCVCPPPPLS